MSVLWAGNMRGTRLQTTVSKLLLLLLLLLSGRTRTVLGQDEDEEPEREEEAQEAKEPVDDNLTPEEEATEPSHEELHTTPSPTGTDATDTEYGANGDEHGSGRSVNVGADPLERTTEVPGTEEPPEDDGLGLLLIAVPVALVVTIIAGVVCVIYTYRRCTSKNRHSEMRKEDPFLEGSSTEKVPMPMFEEDVPSVLELEMDELDDWMKKDGELTDVNQQA